MRDTGRERAILRCRSEVITPTRPHLWHSRIFHVQIEARGVSNWISYCGMTIRSRKSGIGTAEAQAVRQSGAVDLAALRGVHSPTEPFTLDWNEHSFPPKRASAFGGIRILASVPCVRRVLFGCSS